MYFEVVLICFILALICFEVVLIYFIQVFCSLTEALHSLIEVLGSVNGIPICIEPMVTGPEGIFEGEYDYTNA